MSQSQLYAVANAVASGLRSASWMPVGAVSLGFFGKRSIEEPGLVVAVMPKRSESGSITRGGLKQADLEVVVGVFKRLEGTDAEIDQQVEELMSFTQNVEDYFETNALPDRNESLLSVAMDANGDANFDAATLLEKREFQSWVTLTFRGTRQPE